MARTKHTPTPEAPPADAPALSLGEALLDSPLLDGEVADDIGKARSVVKTAYKAKYAERAIALGLSRKAAQRSAWDWLAQSLAAICLAEKDRIDIARFLAVLDANGVDHSKWQNRSKGWEGRLRMTGRLALQKVVAESGILRTGDESEPELEAPADWVAKFRN